MQFAPTQSGAIAEVQISPSDPQFEFFKQAIIPKAATLLLVRQYALEYGASGIRANAVNADRIRSGLMTEDFIMQRAKARGLTEEDYMRGNLLQRERMLLGLQARRLIEGHGPHPLGSR